MEADISDPTEQLHPTETVPRKAHPRKATTADQKSQVIVHYTLYQARLVPASELPDKALEQEKATLERSMSILISDFSLSNDCHDIPFERQLKWRCQRWR